MTATAFVGGGGRGIGRAIAHALAAAGLAVAVAARTSAELDAVVAEVTAAGSRGLALTADLTSPEAARQAVAAAHDHFGSLDVLVNCAGDHPRNYPVEDYPVEYWAHLLNVNLNAAFYCTRVAVPFMKAKGYGRIINIASVAGKMGAPQACGYVAAKHALVGMTKSLAIELGACGITVNAICPGFVETRMTASKAGLRAWATERAAIPRVVEADEVASLVTYLAGPDAGAITGQAMSVCCGLTM